MSEKKVRMMLISEMRDPDGEKQTIRNALSGTMSEENGETVLVYDTNQDGEKARIRMCMRKDRAKMERRGMTSAVLEFLPGVRTSSAYVTMYGDIPVQIDTRNVEIQKSEDGGSLKLVYAVWVSGEKTQDTVLTLQWRVRHDS